MARAASDLKCIGDQFLEFGLALGLTVDDLYDMQTKEIGHFDPVRDIILLWRSHNRSESWHPIAAALDRIGRRDLSTYINKHFLQTESLSSELIICINYISN